MPAKIDQLEILQKQVHSLSRALTKQIFLRDVLLLINTANNAYDRGIVQKMMLGAKLDDGEWTHIFDEASKLELPPTHSEALQKIYNELVTTMIPDTKEGA